MKLVSKTFVLVLFVPFLFIITVIAFLTILQGLRTLMVAGLLPVIGLFSGFANAKEIISEFAVVLLLSLLSMLLSALSLYFLYKFISSIWTDAPIVTHKLIFYILVPLLFSIVSLEIQEPVSEYYNQIYSPVSAAVESDKGSGIPIWVSLIYLIPYSLVIYMHVHFRDKHSNQIANI